MYKCEYKAVVLEPTPNLLLFKNTITFFEKKRDFENRLPDSPFIESNNTKFYYLQEEKH